MHAYCITTQYFIHLVCFEMFSKPIRAITIEWLDAVYEYKEKSIYNPMLR